jgi:mannose-6-phosphate isomerase-like protein (cupin superfamily)
MKYKYSLSEAKTFTKFGVNITAYGENVPTNNIVFEDVEFGHLEEFYDDESTYMWYVVDGYGTFVINDEKIEALKGDLVIVPPKHRVHYFGKMKMVLSVTPAYNSKNEHHVRNVDPSESPYK